MKPPLVYFRHGSDDSGPTELEISDQGATVDIYIDNEEADAFAVINLDQTEVQYLVNELRRWLEEKAL